MDTLTGSEELRPFKSLAIGFLISASMTLFLYSGITLSCYYLIHVTLSLITLIIISSFIFWINIRHDYMSDLVNIISSTVAFDYRFSRPGHVTSISHFLKRINPYIGALGTFSGLLLLFWVLPALVINLISHPEETVIYIYISVFLMSTGICIIYFFTNRDQFTLFTSMLTFFAGVLSGSSGVAAILFIR